jgi:hypothetical protein
MSPQPNHRPDDFEETHPMRFLIATAAAFALLLTSSIAGAYEIRLGLKTGSIDPANITIGQSFVYEVFLDTTNTVGTPTVPASRITLFSASVAYDPTKIAYDKINSYANDYYPLYSPGGTKGVVATYLTPTFDPFGLWPAPPAGKQQINIDFIESNLGNTVASDTNLKLGEIAFNAIGTGNPGIALSFALGGNIFSVEQIDITGKEVPYNGPEVATLAFTSGGTVVVPEPGIAALALGALGTLGFLATRRRS